MSQAEARSVASTVPLRDLISAAGSPTDPYNNEIEADNPTRWTLEDKKRLSVLIGSAVSQLPIWGFAMSYGVFQQYYYENWNLKGSRELTGIIGTTSNGVMYMSMPLLFALFTKRWAAHRQLAAVCGAVLASLSFILSTFSQDVWHLVITQGVLAAFGCALVFSPTTLSLGEWFNTKNRICNRAIAYGICLSSKNIVGATCPFLFQSLLDKLGFRNALRIWVGILGPCVLLSIYLIPTLQNGLTVATNRSRRIPWSFLRHRTFYIYSIATMLQSAGYGIPQTYLTEYARNISLLSSTFSTLLITLINIPGIASSSFFGFLSDNKYIRLSTTTVTSLSALASALSAFLFWGLAAQGESGTALLTLFALTFGFFASGYSATWGGVMNEMEQEAVDRNEAVDTGVVYGLLNGARGVGYVSGGLVSVPLLKAGTGAMGRLGYGTTYGPLIVFTGLSLALGGWGIAWKANWKGPFRFVGVI